MELMYFDETSMRSVRRQDVANFLDRKAHHSARDKLTVVVMENASIHHHIDPNVLEEWTVRDRFFAALQPRYPPHRNPLEAGQVPPALVLDLGKKRLSQ